MPTSRNRIVLALLLVAALAFAPGCATVYDASSPGTLPPPSPPNPYELGLLNKVNEYRQKRGLKQLKLHDIVTSHARLHSQNMAKGRVRFGHDGFPERAKSIRFYLSVMEISENLAVNKGYEDPVDVAFTTLMQSPGHRRNIEGDFDMTGIGVEKTSDGSYYFTQIFVDGAGRFK